MRSLILGQFAVIAALLIILALYSIRYQRDVAAGILLALSTAKPQMAFLILPFVLLWGISQRRTKLVLSLIVSLAVIMIVTLALRPGWPMELFWQILDYPSYTTTISPLAIIAGAAPTINTPLNLLLHGLALVYLIGEWILAWRKEYRWFLWVAFLTLVITNMVAYRTATTNYMMLLPVLFLIFRVVYERWRGVGLAVVLVFMLTLGAGLWLLFFQTVAGNQEHPIMYIPLPFLCLVGLWWVRWWAVKPPRTLYEELAVR
jgi:Gpi18-like mannosyltransferase